MKFLIVRHDKKYIGLKNINKFSGGFSIEDEKI